MFFRTVCSVVILLTHHSELHSQYNPVHYIAPFVTLWCSVLCTYLQIPDNEDVVQVDIWHWSPWRIHLSRFNVQLKCPLYVQ